MKLLLVGGYLSSKDDNEALSILTSFARKSLGKGITILSTGLDELVYELTNTGIKVYDKRNKQNITAEMTIFMRVPKIRFYSDQIYYLSQFCRQNDIKCVNSYEDYYPATKFAQGILFLKNSLALLDTIYSVNKELLIERAENTFGYPFILKSNTGSHGDSNYLVNNRAEAEKATEDEPDTDFLAQQFCPNNCDYRVLIMGNKELVFKRQGGSSTHINNVSKGGKATMARDELSPDIITKSRELAKSLHLNTAGIDIIPNIKTGQLYFLEINSQPQLRTGAFLKEKQELFKSLIEEL